MRPILVIGRANRLANTRLLIVFSLETAGVHLNLVNVYFEGEISRQRELFWFWTVKSSISFSSDILQKPFCDIYSETFLKIKCFNTNYSVLNVYFHEEISRQREIFGILDSWKCPQIL